MLSSICLRQQLTSADFGSASSTSAFLYIYHILFIYCTSMYINIHIQNTITRSVGSSIYMKPLQQNFALVSLGPKSLNLL